MTRNTSLPWCCLFVPVLLLQDMVICLTLEAAGAVGAVPFKGSKYNSITPDTPIKAAAVKG